MKKFLFAFATLLFTGSVAYGNQQVAAKYPDRITYGFDFFVLELDNSLAKGTTFMSGSNIGYEYFTPDAFYFGGDLFAARQTTDFLSKNTALDWNRATRDFVNLDLRAGYTFSCRGAMLAPYLGLGLYTISHIDRYNDQGYSESLPYVAAGLRAEYDINACFAVGLNAKMFHTFGAEERFKYFFEELSNNHSSWGAEIGIPVTWHPDCAKRWSVEVEPYFANLDFSETQKLYGARFQAGYRF